ncbi:transporter substrate-binding domain-containing protein [Rhizobium sp. AU243]|uniref:transporter substrate-binding domain-containing protein n=1 Tax=Rhizobium sp. AU243 TaxID=2303425 RepID=UPI0010CB86D1|nr:transporter substrate-binding domain-containing protein [Rhizobium sp. AU243]TKV70766.1 twin-arginine translocation signal domain-containing protein [Rhizobium sp. AU243]
MSEQNNTRRTFLGLGAAGTAALAALAAVPGKAQSQEGSDDTLQRIRKSGELRIGVAQGEPWFFKDTATNEWHGIGWGVGTYLANELGVKPVAVETTWGNAVAGLQADQFDVMFVLDPTPARSLAIDFPVQPLFYYAQGVLAKDGLDASKWDNLNKPEVRIGVTLGSAMDREVTKRVPNATIQRFPNQDEATAAFAANRIDAVALFHPALVMLQGRLKRGTVVLPQPYRVSSTSAGVGRVADKTFRDWLGLAMGFMYTTGQTQAIYEEYLNYRGIDPKTAPAVMREMWN